MVQAAFRNIKSTQTRHKVIAYEEAEEDEIVDYALYVESEAQPAVKVLILKHHILAQE